MKIFSLLIFFGFVSLSQATTPLKPLPQCTETYIPESYVDVQPDIDHYTFYTIKGEPDLCLEVMNNDSENSGRKTFFRMLTVYENTDSPFIADAKCWTRVDTSARLAFVVPCYLKSPPLTYENIANGMIDALKALHSAGFIHHSLTPTTFGRRAVTQSDGKASGQIVIRNFSTALYPGQLRSEIQVSQDVHVAPEIIDNTYELEVPDVYLSDWYSLGQTLFKILAGSVRKESEEVPSHFWAKYNIPEDLGSKIRDFTASNVLNRRFGDNIMSLTSDQKACSLSSDEIELKDSEKKARNGLLLQMLNSAEACNLAEFENAAQTEISFSAKFNASAGEEIACRSSLLLAAHFKCPEIITLIIERSKRLRSAVGYSSFLKLNDKPGGNIKFQRRTGCTAFHLAAMSCSLESMKVLTTGLNEKSLLELKDSIGNTPLLSAVEYGCFEVAEYLIKDKAVKIDVTNNDFLNILNIAALKGNFDMFSRLKDLLADKFLSLLQISPKSSVKDSTKKSENDLPDIFEIDEDEYSPKDIILISAVQGKNTRLVYYLLDIPEVLREINNVNHKHESALSVAAASLPECVHKLLLYGATSSFDALAAAAAAGNVDALKEMLLFDGNILEIKNEQSIATIATKAGKKEVLEYIHSFLSQDDWIQLTVGSVGSVILSAATADLATLEWLLTDGGLANYVNDIDIHIEFPLCTLIEISKESQNQLFLETGKALLTQGAHFDPTNCLAYDLSKTIEDSLAKHIGDCLSQVANQLLARDDPAIISDDNHPFVKAFSQCPILLAPTQAGKTIFDLIVENERFDALFQIWPKQRDTEFRPDVELKFAAQTALQSGSFRSLQIFGFALSKFSELGKNLDKISSPLLDTGKPSSAMDVLMMSCILRGIRLSPDYNDFYHGILHMPQLFSESLKEILIAGHYPSFSKFIDRATYDKFLIDILTPQNLSDPLIELSFDMLNKKMIEFLLPIIFPTRIFKADFAKKQAQYWINLSIDEFIESACLLTEHLNRLEKSSSDKEKEFCKELQSFDSDDMFVVNALLSMEKNRVRDMITDSINALESEISDFELKFPAKVSCKRMDHGGFYQSIHFGNFNLNYKPKLEKFNRNAIFHTLHDGKSHVMVKVKGLHPNEEICLEYLNSIFHDLENK